MTEEELESRLAENAIDFLERAIDEFKERPKYSIINFYSAVELFLKARLLHEHWSLIVLKDPDRHKFESGDFVSVSFDGLCERLRRVVQSALPDGVQRNFDVVRKHRNRMVHFFHHANDNRGAEIEAVAGEQLRAWYDLHELLISQWSPIFDEYSDRFIGIEEKLKGHREYLQAKFEALGPKIDAEKKLGVKFDMCSSCYFDAARVSSIIGSLHESKCLVCGYQEKGLDYECPECGKTSELDDGGRFVCFACGHKDDEQQIVESINEFKATKDNYFDAMVPANCSECEGYHTVVEYKDHFLCVRCFRVTEGLEQCGWCGEYNNGDMRESSYVGCGICDGAAGWHANKDD
jgi:hypothetical protein